MRLIEKATLKALLGGFDRLDYSLVLDVIRCMFKCESSEVARKVNIAVRGSAIFQPVRWKDRCVVQGAPLFINPRRHHPWPRTSYAPFARGAGCHQCHNSALKLRCVFSLLPSRRFFMITPFSIMITMLMSRFMTHPIYVLFFLGSFACAAVRPRYENPSQGDWVDELINGRDRKTGQWPRSRPHSTFPPLVHRVLPPVFRNGAAC